MHDIHTSGKTCMILDSRQLPNGSTIQADVCIVGAGAAGITIARELIPSGLKVVVLESGGLHRDRAVQELNAGRSNNPFDYGLDESRSRISGGTTSQWSGWCREPSIRAISTAGTGFPTADGR